MVLETKCYFQASGVIIYISLHKSYAIIWISACKGRVWPNGFNLIIGGEIGFTSTHGTLFAHVSWVAGRKWYWRRRQWLESTQVNLMQFKTALRFLFPNICVQWNSKGMNITSPFESTTKENAALKIQCQQTRVIILWSYYFYWKRS